MPKVSIIMINFNGLKYLEETVPVILGLEYPNFEFIVVDNGSTDGSIEYLRKYENVKTLQSPRVREKNFACNYGVKHCAGEFILIMDNDALLTDKHILGKLISRYEQDVGAISLAFCDRGSVRTKGYAGYLGFYFIKEKKEISLEDMKKYDGIEIGFPSGFAFLIRKKIWEEVGGYDSYLKFGGDDNDLGIKLWLFGYKNYLFADSIQVHIGMAERQDNKKYALKWKEMFYAHLYTIFKNYKVGNMIITIVLYSVFSFLKSIKQSVKRRLLSPMGAFFRGYGLFLMSLPVAIQKRKEIQRKRMIASDIFLKIDPPSLFK